MIKVSIEVTTINVKIRTKFIPALHLFFIWLVDNYPFYSMTDKKDLALIIWAWSIILKKAKSKSEKSILKFPLPVAYVLLHVMNKDIDWIGKCIEEKDELFILEALRVDIVQGLEKGLQSNKLSNRFRI